VYAITIHPLKASFPYGCHVMTTRCDIILIQTKQNPQVTTIQTRDLFSRGPRQLHSRCTPVQLTRSYLDAFDLRSRAARRICAAHQPRPRINRDRAWVFPPPSLTLLVHAGLCDDFAHIYAYYACQRICIFNDAYVRHNCIIFNRSNVLWCV